jgi:hypothetical protein
MTVTHEDHEFDEGITLGDKHLWRLLGKLDSQTSITLGIVTELKQANERHAQQLNETRDRITVLEANVGSLKSEGLFTASERVTLVEQVNHAHQRIDTLKECVEHPTADDHLTRPAVAWVYRQMQNSDWWRRRWVSVVASFLIFLFTVLTFYFNFIHPLR